MGTFIMSNVPVAALTAGRPQKARNQGSLNSPPGPLEVRPIPFRTARAPLIRHHYLHSMPGGTQLSLGVFLTGHIRGALTLGVGPTNAHLLVEGARPDDCLTLTRMWLGDGLPANAASKVVGLTLRSLKRHTSIRFLITYADPAQGHVGTIYQATNWLYTGLSEPMPLYDIGDGNVRHSRSLSHAYGSHSVKHFAKHGVNVRLVPQSPKYRYVYFLDSTWRSRLRAPVLPYPKMEALDAHS